MEADKANTFLEQEKISVLMRKFAVTSGLCTGSDPFVIRGSS